MEIRAEPHWPGGVHRQQKKLYLSKFRAKKGPFLGFLGISLIKSVRIESAVKCSKMLLIP